MQGDVEIYTDKRLGALVVFGGLVMVGVGIYAYLDPLFLNPVWFGLLGAIGILFGCFLLFDPRLKLLIADDYLIDNKSGIGKLELVELAGVRYGTFNHGPYLYLELLDVSLAGELIQKQGRWKFPRPDDALPNEVTIPLAGMRIKPADLVALIKQRVDA